MSPGSNTPLWPLLVLDGRHPLACLKRRLNGAACLPWAATSALGGMDPGG